MTAAQKCGTGRHRDRCGAGGRGHARAHSAGCAVPPAGCRYLMSSIGSVWRSVPRSLRKAARRMCSSCRLRRFRARSHSSCTAIWMCPCWTRSRPEEVRSRPTPWAKTCASVLPPSWAQVGLGGQAYVACPLIEDSENAENKAEKARSSMQKTAEAASAPARGCILRTGRMKMRKKIRSCAILQRAEIRYSGRNNGYRGRCDAERQSDGGRGRRPVRSVAAASAARTGRRGTRQSYCVFFGADKGQVARERLRTV